VRMKLNDIFSGCMHRAYFVSNNISSAAEIYTLSLHDALPISAGQWVRLEVPASQVGLEGQTLNGLAFTLFNGRATWDHAGKVTRSEEHTSELQSRSELVCRLPLEKKQTPPPGETGWVEDTTPA